jgi:arylsulfatase A-like enzyme
MRVLLLDLDTLRPDHLGCYGYHRDTSPNLDRIAAAGTRFDNYHCSDAPCLPSRAALVSGMFGIHNGAVGHGGTCADLRLEGAARHFRSAVAENSLWQVFRKAGMHTCTISPFAERHSSFWFLAGFNEMHNHVGKGGNESAEEITPTVLKWLADNADRQDWLLHVNYWDAHTPYRAPADFGNPFADDPLPGWLTEARLAEHVALAGPHTARDNSMYSGDSSDAFPRQVGDVKDMAALRRCLDGYDCGIRYMDGHIGRILAALEAQGILADTAIIVTADHGENFGELGMYSEHGTADRATCRIPMIVTWPGMQKDQVDNGLHYHLDLVPTVAELLGVKPWEAWDGQSYAATLRTGADTGRDELVLSQCAHVCQRSVLWDNWLYMKTYHDGFHPHFADEMLFDLATDPHETANLAGARPDLCRDGASRLRAWHAAQMKTMPFGDTADPMDTVLAEGGPEHARIGWSPTRAYAQRLQDTGRGDWLAEIHRRHPNFGA